jgi:hypothetical protein
MRGDDDVAADDWASRCRRRPRGRSGGGGGVGADVLEVGVDGDDGLAGGVDLVLQQKVGRFDLSLESIFRHCLSPSHSSISREHLRPALASITMSASIPAPPLVTGRIDEVVGPVR